MKDLGFNAGTFARVSELGGEVQELTGATAKRGGMPFLGTEEIAAS